MMYLVFLPPHHLLNVSKIQIANKHEDAWCGAEVQLYVFFVCEKSSVRISAGIPGILTECPRVSSVPSSKCMDIMVTSRPLPSKALANSTLVRYLTDQRCTASQRRIQLVQESNAPSTEEAHITVLHALSDTPGFITVVFPEIKYLKL
jgi:hypothetical protein